MIFAFLRITSFFTSSSILFPQGTPNIVKILLCLFLSVVISLNTGINIQPENMYMLVSYGVLEILTGLFLGYITSICFNAIKIGGQLIDIQMGLSMANIYDATTKTQTTLIGNLVYWIGVLVFFSMNGHHILIEGLQYSFKIIEIGTPIIENNLDYLIKIFVEYFTIGFKISIPVSLALLISEIVMGLVSRSVPQFNVMILGMPMKILVGTLFLLVSLPFIVNESYGLFNVLSKIMSGTFNIR